MSRKSNSAERRLQIVQALLAVIAEHGYDKATIQLIAREAGLAPGLLHYHFASKAEMLLALVGMLAEGARQRYLAGVDEAADPARRLHAYLHARLARGEGADGKAVAAWVMIGAEAVRQPEVREVYREAVGAELALLEGLLGDALAWRGKARGSAAALAAAVLALMQGAFQLASAAPGVLPEGYAFDSALQLVERSIEAAAPG